MTFTPQAVLAEEGRRAEEVYDRIVRPALRLEDENKYVAVAFEVDDYEIDSDDCTAIQRLTARRPGARLWLMRVGDRAAYRARSPRVIES